MDIKRGIEMGVNAVVADIRRRSKKVSTSEEIEQVGTISANGDREIGEMLSRAMKRVGNEAVITVEEAKSLDTELELSKACNSTVAISAPSPHNQERRLPQLPKPVTFVTGAKSDFSKWL